MVTATEILTGKFQTLPSTAGPISYEQFLAWADEDTYAEWVDGKVVFMSPVPREHSLVKQFLMKVIGYYVETHQLGEIHDDPFQMKTGAELPGRAPDIIFITNENLGRLRKNYLEGPADLAVEVISLESRGRDRGEKFYEYEQGGVKEYWLIDSPRKKAEFYQLGPDGFYQLMELSAEGRFASDVLPRFWLNVDWLWQSPLPKLPQVLNAWGMV